MVETAHDCFAGVSTQPKALEDVEFAAMVRGHHRNFPNDPHGIRQVRGREDHNEGSGNVRLLNLRFGRLDNLTVATGAALRLFGWPPTWWIWLIGRLLVRGRLWLQGGLTGATAPRFHGIRVRLLGRLRFRGGRQLVGEEAAPLLRQHQDQAASQDQRSNDTVPHA